MLLACDNSPEGTCKDWHLKTHSLHNRTLLYCDTFMTLSITPQSYLTDRPPSSEDELEVDTRKVGVFWPSSEVTWSNQASNEVTLPTISLFFALGHNWEIRRSTKLYSDLEGFFDSHWSVKARGSKARTTMALLFLNVHTCWRRHHAPQPVIMNFGVRSSAFMGTNTRKQTSLRMLIAAFVQRHLNT